MKLQLDQDGAELFPCLTTAVAISELEQVLQSYAVSSGIRIFGDPALARWLSDSPIAELVNSTAGRGTQPVRAIVFDKTVDANWALAWHQDRTIAVRERVEYPGFVHWTTKSGVPHVEPPFSIIETMLTARIHIDPVADTNAPLLVAPGSHRFGRIKESAIEKIVDQCGRVACTAERGDVWLYRTAILHASEKSHSNGRRRVLQVDFSSKELPGGLEWLGIA